MDYSEYVKRRDWYWGTQLQRWFCRRLLKVVIKTTKKNPRDCYLLEVGSGIGILGEIAQNLNFAKFTAIEPNADLANETRRRLPGIEVHEIYLPDTPSDLIEKFDLVIAVHVVEHAKDGYEARTWIESMWQFVKPDGNLLVVSPNLLDYKSYFWEIDWSHCFPTSVNSLTQIYKDLNISIDKACVMRLGSLAPLVTSMGFLFSYFFPTRFINLVSKKMFGRELGTGLMAGAFWGVTFVLGKKKKIL